MINLKFEINDTGCVDDVVTMVPTCECGDNQGGGDPPLLILTYSLNIDSYPLDLYQIPSVAKDALGGFSLDGINVGHYIDVIVHVKIYRPLFRQG